MIRIIVSGGRDYQDRPKLYSILDKYLLIFHEARDIMIVYGAARGADTLAKEWAKSRGCSVEPHPADWDQYQKRGGTIRNAELETINEKRGHSSPSV